MRPHIRPTPAIGLLATLTIVLVAALVTFLLWDMRKRELESARLDTVGHVHALREGTERLFDEVDVALRGVQERMQTRYGASLPAEGSVVRLLLGARVFGIRQLGALKLLDERGVLINSSSQDELAGASHAGNDYFKAFAEERVEGLFVGRLMRNPSDGGWTLPVARAYTGIDGKFRGVILAAVDIAKLEQALRAMQADNPRAMSLYMADGTVVAGVPHRDSLTGGPAPELGAASLAALRDDVRMVDHATGDGGRQAIGVARMSRYPLLVGSPHDEELALAAWRENSIAIVGGALLLCALVAIAAALLIRAVKRQAELARALRDANDRYHLTIHSVMDAIIAVDASHEILLFNPAAERMFGRTREQMLGQPLSMLLPEAVRESHSLHMDRFMCGHGKSRPMAANTDIMGLRADGSEFPIESTISQTMIDGRPQLTAVLRDITQRRRAEEEMREMNRQLRSLSASLQEVREQERTRIALELHDDLGQQLTGIKLELSWLGARLKEGRPATADEVAGMRQLLDAAISSVRRIASDLRPLLLDELGFGEAVTWQTGEFAKRTGLEIGLDLQAQELVKDDVVATALFRIVQEALTNVARHSGATRVGVSLKAQATDLLLTVSDNGNGNAVGGPRGQGRQGIGLVSMRERAGALGGQFRITGVPGAGTTIEVALPLGRALAGVTP